MKNLIPTNIFKCSQVDCMCFCVSNTFKWHTCHAGISPTKSVSIVNKLYFVVVYQKVRCNKKGNFVHKTQSKHTQNTIKIFRNTTRAKLTVTIIVSLQISIVTSAIYNNSGEKKK